MFKMTLEKLFHSLKILEKRDRKINHSLTDLIEKITTIKEKEHNVLQLIELKNQSQILRIFEGR